MKESTHFSPRARTNETSRPILTIALTLLLLLVGAIGIIQFRADHKKSEPESHLPAFVPGNYEGEQLLWIQPRDHPEKQIRITYSFGYAAIPAYGGNETITTRLQVFQKEAQRFLHPMREKDLVSPKAKEMIQKALYTVLESSLFPRARGRVTEFAIHKIRLL